MGLFNKFKDLVGIEEVDDDDITEEEIERAATQIERKQIEAHTPYQPMKQEAKGMKDISKDPKVMPMPMQRPSISDKTGAMKMLVIEPSTFDDSQKFVDSLKTRRPVILNLANMDPTVARKIFDFMSGATYALNGNVQKIADGIFVFAPDNVDISGNIEHKGFDFSGNGSKSPWR